MSNSSDFEISTSLFQPPYLTASKLNKMEEHILGMHDLRKYLFIVWDGLHMCESHEGWQGF